VLAAALLLLPALSVAQSGYTIGTFAGTGGSAGFSGDGSAANTAQLSGPIGLVVDSSGNLYIADENNQRIRKVSGGTINTIVGNGTKGYSGDGAAATSAELSLPNAVALDKSGNLYILDSGNWVVRKVTTGGTISTVAGNQFNSSQQSGGFAGDNGPATSAQFALATGVAVDSAGNMYISDTGNNRIRKVDTNGNMSTVVNGGISGGTVGSGGDGGPGIQARINNPGGLAVDTAGNLYIADTNNNKIRKLATNGIITTVAGNQFAEAGFSGDGGPATSAMLNHPQGVAVDAAGNLYIADRTNSRIRMVSPNGTITTIAGNGKFGYTGDGGPATAAALNFPDDIAVDSNGNVYVADYQNQVIRLLTPVGPPPGSNPPSINAGGVVSASAFGAFTSIAPGSWIEIYGSNLAADTRGWTTGDFNGTTAPISLDQTSVTIGGQNAFVDYISPGQVNVQAPSTLATGQQPIVLSTAAGASAAYTITVNPTAPGLLAPPSFVIGGQQYVVAQFNDFATYVLPVGAIAGVPSRPAKPGETIIIYGIGFGVVPGVNAGQIAPATSALATPPQIFFGSSLAAMPYAGLAPNYVGLYQFNVTVPNVAPNNAEPLTFTLLGVPGAQKLVTAVGN